MDAEIRFFMRPEDEAEFLIFAQKYIDEIKYGDTEKQRFIIGDCELFYTPTVIEDKTLFTGVLEIRIDHNSDTACKNQLNANATYKKLRNWIKKKYWSRLAFIDKTKKDRLTPSRIYWLAPEAKVWKESNAKVHKLKLSQTSWMEFDIGF